MVSFISSWAQGIIISIIIATIIEIVLPEGNNKKYVKTIIGIYIIFVMINPLISKISNKSININKILEDARKEAEEIEINDLTIETNRYIQETYIDKLEDDIKQKVKEKGYNVNSFNLKIETEDEENYGYIKQIDLCISKIDEIQESENITNNMIEEIENVEIKISDNNEIDNNITNEKESISSGEKEILIDYLSNEYGIDKKEIHIKE